MIHFLINCLINSLKKVRPGNVGRLPADELLGLEPERDLLLRRVDGVGAVADVAADLNLIE